MRPSNSISAKAASARQRRATSFEERDEIIGAVVTQPVVPSRSEHFDQDREPGLRPVAVRRTPEYLEATQLPINAPDGALVNFDNLNNLGSAQEVPLPTEDQNAAFWSTFREGLDENIWELPDIEGLPGAELEAFLTEQVGAGLQ